MKQIQEFSIQALHQEEAFGFHQLIYAELFKSNEGFDQVLTTYKEALDAFDLALAPLRKSELTNSVTVLDERRDNAYRGFRRQVSMGLEHINANKVAAAKKVEVVLNRYEIPINLPYIEESGVLENLVQDLSPADLVKAIATLDASDWLSELKTAQAAFVQAFVNRNTEQSNIEVGQSKKTRTAVDQAYKSCIYWINAYVRLYDSETHGELIDRINQLISYQRNVLVLRKAKKKTSSPKNESE